MTVQQLLFSKNGVVFVPRRRPSMELHSPLPAPLIVGRIPKHRSCITSGMFDKPDRTSRIAGPLIPVGICLSGTAYYGALYRLHGVMYRVTLGRSAPNTC
jgi:hypothetical protein